MIFALTAIIFTLFAYIAWRERSYDKQTAEREQAHRLQVTGLLNRIQVPEAAPFIDTEDNGQLQYAPFEDDEAFEQAVDILKEVEYTEEPAA